MRRHKKWSKYPFIFLLLIHSVLLAFSFYRSNDRKRLFVLLFSNIGMAYLFEYIVLNVFRGYQYKAFFIKNKELNNILGAIFSQAIFVPFTALFITSMHWGWKAKCLFTLYFAAVETLFLRIGIYKQNWWRTIYTSIFLPIFFTLSDKWYEHLKRRTPFVMFTSLFLISMATNVNMLFILAVNRKFKFGYGWFHSWREHFLLAPLYSIVVSLVSNFLLIYKHSISKVGNFIFRIALDTILVKRHLIKFKYKKFTSHLLYHAFMIFMGGIYKRMVYGGKACEK